MLKIRITGPVPLLEHIKDELSKPRLTVYRQRSDRHSGSIYLNADADETGYFVEAMKSAMAKPRWK